jgi:hypothetical protein
MKKVVFSMKVLSSIYNIIEGFLRCGDDLIFNEDKLVRFLEKTVKHDYMGFILHENGNKKKIDNFMPSYFIEHPEDLINPLNGLQQLTIEQIKTMNIVPDISFSSGVLIYFSLNACNLLIQEMEKVNWNVFHYEEQFGFTYMTEDIGNAFALKKNNILPINYKLFTHDINEQNIESIAHHTNKFK